MLAEPQVFVYVVHKQFDGKFVFVGAYSSEENASAVVSDLVETCIVTTLALDRTLAPAPWSMLSAYRQTFAEQEGRDQFVFYPEEAYL